MYKISWRHLYLLISTRDNENLLAYESISLTAWLTVSPVIGYFSAFAALYTGFLSFGFGIFIAIIIIRSWDLLRALSRLHSLIASCRLEYFSDRIISLILSCSLSLKFNKA